MGREEAIAARRHRNAARGPGRPDRGRHTRGRPLGKPAGGHTENEGPGAQKGEQGASWARKRGAAGRGGLFVRRRQVTDRFPDPSWRRNTGSGTAPTH